MNTTVKKMVRSALALVLAMTMLLGTIGTALALTVKDHDSDGVIRYASLGASNTNGYGIRGYLPIEVTMDPLIADKSTLNVYGYDRAPETAYPAQVAAALAAASGKKVEISQLAISSMRVEEVRMLLDDTYYGDEYTAWRFYNENGEGWFAQAESQGANSGEQALANLRKAYQDALANADVISVDLGMNNFGVYTFNNIKRIMGSGSYWKAPDFSLIMTPENEEKYENVKGMLLNTLVSSTEGMDEATAKKLDMVAEVLTYATLGFCHNFDIVMGKIYEMNPDATVVVVGVQNLLHGVKTDFGSGSLPLGDIYGMAIEVANTYTKSVSPYASRYSHATVADGHAHTFLDEIREWNGDPTTLTDNMKDCFDMYDDGLYVRSIIEYIMVAPALGIEMPKSLQEMIASGSISLDKLDLSDSELLAYIGQAAQKLATFRLGQNLTEQEKPVYNAYVNTLNTVYGIIATIVQEAAKIDTLNLGGDSFDGFGSKSDELMGYIFGEVIKGAQSAFMGTLQNPDYTYNFEMNKELLADPGIAAVAMLAVRFDLGNSFFAHPSEVGHDQITDTILAAIKTGPQDTAYLHRYETTENSHYLALGDSVIYGTAADGLANRLNSAVEAGVGYTNLTVVDQTAAQLLAILPNHIAEIEKADLITLGFSTNRMNKFVISQLSAVLTNKTPESMDWEQLLGAENAASVQGLLADIKAKIAEGVGGGKVMGLDIGQVVSVAIESYVYSYIEHLISYYEVCTAIHAINPDVQILTVGAYNPMVGVTLNMEGETMDVGSYLQYLVDLTNVVYLAAGATTDNCTYVAVPDVKTNAEPPTYEMGPFIMELLFKGVDKYNPAADSYAYVEEQLWNALDVTVKSEEPEPEPTPEPEPEPEVVLGDVNNDGKVDFVDAMLTLQHYTGEVGAEALDVAASDVNADGKVDFVDAMLILQHYTHEIAVFPAN